MMVVPLKTLKSQLKRFGINEMLKVLVECVDTDMVGNYLKYLVYLEWIKKHPIIEEEQEENKSIFRKERVIR